MEIGYSPGCSSPHVLIFYYLPFFIALYHAAALYGTRLGRRREGGRMGGGKVSAALLDLFYFSNPST